MLVAAFPITETFNPPRVVSTVNVGVPQVEAFEITVTVEVTRTVEAAVVPLTINPEIVQAAQLVEAVCLPTIIPSKEYALLFCRMT